jgi:23S rRNA pseudouridine955/2504/2580 synthase
LGFGTVAKVKDVLTAYLKKNAEQALVKVFDQPRAGAEKIVTEYQVLDTMDGLTKVEVTLHTGKTHQIRAHLAHVGCPILGDMKYGNAQVNKEKKLARQCLVAKYLRFETNYVTAEGEMIYGC